MRLRLPRSLHYPITVTELLKQPGDNVEQLSPLFAYFYQTTVTEGDPFGEVQEVEKTFPTRYESPVEGKLKVWRIQKGAVIASHDVDVAEIEELCSHSVQYAGMCTLCGEDMTRLTYNTDISYADRATINIVHDNTALTISNDEASKIEEDAKRRLLRSRKLSLVVDLDQTVIHATVDPTVAEWQQDQSNPNHDAVKDVQSFQLMDDGPGMRGCRYYIKLRPGLQDFLSSIARLYELHIYTMGTRAYAQNVARIVDPDRKIFGDRILSRDESGSMTAKSLQRLFPVDTKMVVIIDDRGDVWQWSEHLVKVTPYDFFVGIGDINSSFLPKKPELLQKDPSPAGPGPRRLKLTMPRPNRDRAEGATIREPEPQLPDGDENGDGQDSPSASQNATAGPESLPTSDPPTLDRLVSMGGGADPTVLQQQASKQDEALAAQLEDRPLLQKQKALDAEDEAAAAAASTENHTADEEDDTAEPSHDDDNNPRPQQQRQNLLHDDDTELHFLERNLREVHRAFFEEYDRRLRVAPGTRLAALRGEKASSRKRTGRDEKADLDLVPDIKAIMPPMKQSVLNGVRLVFSGVLPLGTDVQRSDIALWAKSFGAHVSEHVNRRTTHVIAGRNRTNKVRQAARRAHISIVTPFWLVHSISQWQWLDEEPYLVPVDPQDREPPTSNNLDDVPGLMSSSDDDDHDSPSEDETMDEGFDSEDDPEGVRPAELEDNVSPIEGFFEHYDQQEVDTELAEFLGSDNEGSSDQESVHSNSDQTGRTTTTTTLADRRRKRKRSRSSSPSSDQGGSSDSEKDKEKEAAEDASRSRLAKRQQRARERTTGLKTVANATDVSSSLPTPDITGEDEEDEEEKKNEGDDGEEKEGDDGEEKKEEEENSDDELARELFAEMSRESDEEDT
ncbi:MAG: hypothetical protein M1823_001563 [Watsoniomyces obsoletus]|nr:MAG: hypothetical protein M1823_001563 [Watsoniomyces obsoletus]